MNGYQRVYATQKPEGEQRRGFHACNRCGRVRESRATTILCRDCRDTLTTAEQELWAA